MNTSDAYHNHGIKDFKAVATKYLDNCTSVTLEAKSHSCPCCGSLDIKVMPLRSRFIVGLPTGPRKTLFEVCSCRVYCHACHQSLYEPLAFLPYQKCRLTRSACTYLVELRKTMTLGMVARHFGIDTDTVKSIETLYLKRHYGNGKARLRDVKNLGVDEIYLFRSATGEGDDQKYLTVVRDNDTGHVLFVGRGKGVKALKEFTVSLKRSHSRIETVTMDMSNSYAKWVDDNLPGAVVVYDHFHVVKAANDALDKVRRMCAGKLDRASASTLKGNRFLLLRDAESLGEDEVERLDSMRDSIHGLRDAYMLKEELRGIYRYASSAEDARSRLEQWMLDARAVDLAPFRTLANTIQRHLDGICAFWACARATNAGAEGFNNKIRHLFSIAYGYRDVDYFILKIYELPECRLSTTLNKTA